MSTEMQKIYDVKFLEINVTTVASLPFIELPHINLMQKHLFAYLYQKHQLDCGPSAHFFSFEITFADY